MKQYLIIIALLSFFSQGNAQLAIGNNTSWIVTGNASVVLQDISLANNGTIAAGTGSFKFTGTQNANINGTTMPSFYILEMAKSNSSRVLLDRNITVNSTIVFASGQLDLNGNNILLASGANLSGETELNRIISANGGFIEITQTLNAPNGSNPGNLGAFITSSVNLGSVTIRRGHSPQTGTGLPASINRYYNIQPTNNSNLNATLRLKYFDSELNGQIENNLTVYQSVNSGSSWNNISRSTNSTTANYVEKTSLPGLYLQTLANDNVQITNGVTGLLFTGARKKATEVQLKWTSQTETNMTRYQIQRKLDTELDFSDRASVNTLAAGGNSTSLLSYQNIDANAHTGNSYYRLKIIATDNSFTYSNIITVAGKSKVKGGGNNGFTLISGEETATTKSMSNNSFDAKAVTVGPNPNNGNFWFRVNGLEKETVAVLYSIDGKKIGQFRIVNLQQQHVNGIRTGIYLLKIPGFETQKIIVNGRGNGSPASPQAIDNTKL